MSVLVPRESRAGSAPISPSRSRELLRPQRTPIVEPVATAAQAGSETHRWLLIIGIPFVLGATFFGLAIGLGAEWPMAPAFVLGPLLMIAGYIVLCLTSEANTTTV